MKKKLIIIALIMLALLVGYTIYFFYSIKAPKDKSSTENISFEVIEGQSTADIATHLEKLGIIRSAFTFQIFTHIKNGQLLPGIYYLRKNQSYDDIISVLSQGQINEQKITIPEGWRVTQIAQYLDDKKIVSYDDFMAKAKNLEGYLFPDTYNLSIETSVDKIITIMYAAFNQKTAPLNLTKEELILASIVEREANATDDRAKIAGVYQNRLDADMFMGADPTIQYALGSWDPITQADYQSVDSLYNTYINKGLPPGPICNPGLASIKAAINPAEHDYYYFFHTSDGQTIYSKTLEEHEANITQYQ